MLTASSMILQVNHLQQLSGNSHLRTNLCSLMSQYLWVLVFTISGFLLPVKTGLIFDCFSVIMKSLYPIKIKEQARNLTAGCSKQYFKVVDKTDEYIIQGEADLV